MKYIKESGNLEEDSENDNDKKNNKDIKLEENQNDDEIQRAKLQENEIIEKIMNDYESNGVCTGSILGEIESFRQGKHYKDIEDLKRAIELKTCPYYYCRQKVNQLLLDACEGLCTNCAVGLYSYYNEAGYGFDRQNNKFIFQEDDDEGSESGEVSNSGEGSLSTKE